MCMWPQFYLHWIELIFWNRIVFYLSNRGSACQTAIYQSPGLSPGLRLLISEAKPKPVASPHQGQARLGLERARLSGLKAWGPAQHITTSKNTFKYLMSLRIIAGSMVALSLCRGFWSRYMIMDSWCISCLTSSALTHLHFSISAGAEPFQKEETCQMALNAFTAAIAEFNNCNGRFEDE